MELIQLKCFIAVAEELHFGNAAYRLNMLPSALGRYVKLLENSLGTRLLTRSTRHVQLTAHGELFLIEAKQLVAAADNLQRRFQQLSRIEAQHLRIGAIDSAAVGLIPYIMQHFAQQHPNIHLHIIEDRTSKLLPKLRAGQLDLIFSRTLSPDPQLEKRVLLYESVSLVVAEQHPLSQKSQIYIEDLIDIPLIVPERKIRPHSHDLALCLFENSSIKPHLIQIADEKLTILNMIAANLGVAVMPHWACHLSPLKLKSIPFAPQYQQLQRQLPISACWRKNYPDPSRDQLLSFIFAHAPHIAAFYATAEFPLQ